MVAEGRKGVPDEIWTTEDVAEYFKCSPDNIINRAKAGDIPSFKLGALWRFNKDKIRKLAA